MLAACMVARLIKAVIDAPSESQIGHISFSSLGVDLRSQGASTQQESFLVASVLLLFRNYGVEYCAHLPNAFPGHVRLIPLGFKVLRIGRSNTWAFVGWTGNT